jgi:hypothetical protein
MPHSLFLDQSHIGTVCTRPQLASQTCPKASIYGSAEATTPLLDEKLKGNVYLVSSDHKLPDLLADLRGQVNIQIRGVISSKRGGLKSVFNTLPDVPVKKFVLNMKGGEKSLLVNSTNTCKEKQTAVLNFKGQIGDHGGGVIGGIVVDDDQLVAVTQLRQQRRQRPPQLLAAVPGDDQD